MTLSAILDLVKQIYPRAGVTLSDNGIVTFLNQELRTLYREVQIDDKYEMTTTANEPTYALPTDIEPEDIFYIGICDDTTLDDESRFIEYRYIRGDENFSAHNWYVHISDGGTRSLGIYPVPTTSTSHIRILYKKRPTMFSLATPTAEPEINEDYQMLLVYGVLARIAAMGSSPDIDQANNFRTEYNVLLLDAKKAVAERDVFYRVTKDRMKKMTPARRFGRLASLLFEEQYASSKTPNDTMTSDDP
jgi:hypothetical protein